MTRTDVHAGGSVGEVPVPDSAARATANLQVNSLALMLSNGAVSVLGLVFWAVAARMYPADQVGVTSALISSTLMLATLSNLSLGAMFERFLPVAGVHAWPSIQRAFLAVAAMACVLAIGLVLVGPKHRLFHGTWSIVAFIGGVVTMAIFVLLDQTANGLGVGRWAAAKNTTHAVAKLVALVIFAGTASSMAIYLSWIVPAAIAVVIVVAKVRRRIETDPRFSAVPQLPALRVMVTYFGTSYGITVLTAMSPLIVPLIVIAQVGTAQNAYFFIAWSLVSALYMAMWLLAGPFVAEVAANPGHLRHLLVRFTAMVSLVAIAGSVALATVGPLVLGFVGADYRTHGSPILWLAACTFPIAVVSVIYDSIARVRKNLKLAIIVKVLSTMTVAIGTFTLTRSHGITGFGWAYMLSEVGAAVILFVPCVRAFRTCVNMSEAEAAALTHE